MSRQRSKGGAAIVPAALVVLSSLLGLILVEGVYRIYLYKSEPQQFVLSPVAAEHPAVWYFQDSPWRYNEAFGYEYVPGIFQGGSITEGKVQSCWDWHTNVRGNIGRIKGDYASADLKVLVFGDSWTAQQRSAKDGVRMTWPNFLQDSLEATTRRSVHVVNMGRDGTGLLQMFDLAAAKVPEWQPDLVVFAFITDDLTRDRFWRTKAIIDGKSRIMVSLEPDAAPDWRQATDVAVMNHQASREWCERVRDTEAVDDPVVSALEEALLDGRRRSTLLADPLTVRNSFLYDQVVHGTPYRHVAKMAKPSQNPRHEYLEFAADPRMLANVAALEKSDIPYVLAHLAIYPELEADEEFIADQRQLNLLASLEVLTGRVVHGTLDHVKRPVLEPERFSGSFPEDHHPSLEGQIFYAELTARMLLQNGFLD